MFKSKVEPTTRRFYYVQRFQPPMAGIEAVDTDKSQAGYGGEYMGSSEYEVGGLNISYKALVGAKKLAISTVDVDGVAVSMLFIEAEGDPSEQLLEWYNSDQNGPKDRYTPKCPGKERSRFEDAISVAKGEGERSSYNRTVMWWSHLVRDAGENVIFGLADEPHFANFVEWINKRREAAGKKPVVGA